MAQQLPKQDQHVARLVVREGMCSVHEIRLYIEGYLRTPETQRPHDFAAFLEKKCLLSRRQAERLRNAPFRPSNQTTRTRARMRPVGEQAPPAQSAETAQTAPAAQPGQSNTQRRISARVAAQQALADRYERESRVVDQFLAVGDVERALLMHRKLKPVPMQELDHSIKGADLVRKCADKAEQVGKMGDFEEALRLTTMLLDLQPGNAGVAIARAQWLIQLGRLHEALEAIDYVEVRFPKHHAAMERHLRAALLEAEERHANTEVDQDTRAEWNEVEQELRRRLSMLEREKEGLQAEKQHLEARVDGMAQQRDSLEQQLRDTETMLKEERQKMISKDQFTVSEHGIGNLQKLFDQMATRAITENNISDALATDMRELVAHLLDDEREKIAERERQAQSKKISVLEQKVRRLSQTLSETEKERDKHARVVQHLSTTGGGVSVAHVETGLSDEDPEKEQKLELLKEIFKHNMEMREAMGKRVKKVKPKPKKEEKDGEGYPTADEISRGEGSATPKSPVPDAPEQVEPAEEPAEELEPTEALAMGEDQAVDPDDMIWEPGMSFSREPDLEDDDRTVKKITVNKFEPPPLQRK